LLESGQALKILEQLKALSKEKYCRPVDIAIIYTGVGIETGVSVARESVSGTYGSYTELSEPHFDQPAFDRVLGSHETHRSAL